MIETMSDVFVNAFCKALLTGRRLPCESQTLTATLTAQAEVAGKELARIVRNVEVESSLYLGLGDPRSDAEQPEAQRPAPARREG